MDKKSEDTATDEDTKAIGAAEVVPEEELPDEDPDFFTKSLAKFRREPFTPPRGGTGEEDT